MNRLLPFSAFFFVLLVVVACVGGVIPAANAQVVGCITRATPLPTLAPGQPITPACDLNSKIYTNGAAASTPVPLPTDTSGNVLVNCAVNCGTPIPFPSGFGANAVTGNGFTQYPLTYATSATAAQIGTGALTFAGIYIGWAVPSTITNCYLQLFNVAAPTVGTTVPVRQYTLSTATPGGFAANTPPTIGTAFAALSYAITTLPSGSVACNTLASQLWAQGDYK